MVRFAELLQSELSSSFEEKDAETPKKQLNLNLVFRGHLQEKELSEAELLPCKVKLATVLYVCQIKPYFFLDCSCIVIYPYRCF